MEHAPLPRIEPQSARIWGFSNLLQLIYFMSLTWGIGFCGGCPHWFHSPPLPRPAPPSLSPSCTLPPQLSTPLTAWCLSSLCRQPEDQHQWGLPASTTYSGGVNMPFITFAPPTASTVAVPVMGHPRIRLWNSVPENCLQSLPWKYGVFMSSPHAVKLSLCISKFI